MGSRSTRGQWTGAESLGLALADAGVTDIFGVHGYINPVIEAACRAGTSMHHFRHEQSAGFAADAYARVTRRPGVCFASASAGHANYLAPLSQAFGALSPVVLLVGQHGTAGDGLHILQEGYATENLRSVAKWTHRVLDADMAAYWASRALREAVSYPPGPVVLELPLNMMSRRFEHPRKWLPSASAPSVPVAGPDPQAIEATVEAILAANRPVLIGGDGVYWSDGVAEFRRLAELAQLPAGSRRTARGLIAEDDPLGHGASARPTLLREADLICLVGVRSSELEGWFEPPDWPQDITYIQMNETPDEVWYGLPTAVTVTGASRLALAAVCDGLERTFASSTSRSEWLELRDREAWCARLADARDEAAERSAKRRLLPAPDGFGISTAQLTNAIAETMDPNATVIFDSYSGSLYLTDDVIARYPGQILDAGPRVALGQGIGMCIGALVGRAESPAVTLVGDGGFGISGFDLETLMSLGLPGVVVIHNNSTWGGTSLRQDLFHPDLPEWKTSSTSRYDGVSEALGVHAERVTELHELRPALERAFASGLPAVVDVLADDASPRVSDPWMRLKITEIAGKGFHGYPEEAIQMFRTLGPRGAARLLKSCLDNGVEVSLELISDLTGVPQAELAAISISHSVSGIPLDAPTPFSHAAPPEWRR